MCRTREGILTRLAVAGCASWPEKTFIHREVGKEDAREESAETHAYVTHEPYPHAPAFRRPRHTDLRCRHDPTQHDEPVRACHRPIASADARLARSRADRGGDGARGSAGAVATGEN